MSLGAGVFAMPFCFLKLGIVNGVLLISLLGALALVAHLCLLDLAAVTGIDSYEGLAEHAFGVCGTVGMATLTLVTTFIATLSYLSVACSLLQNLAVAYLVELDVNTVQGGVQVLSETKEACLLALLIMLVLPRLLGDRIDPWISMFGVAAISSSSVIFVGYCVVKLLQGCDDKTCGPSAPLVESTFMDVLQYTAELAFSFSMVFAIFPVLQERRQRRVGENVIEAPVKDAVRVMKPAVAASVTLSCVIYITVGVAGVLAFRTKANSFALSNMSLLSPLGQLISLVVGVSVLLLVACISFPCIASAELLIKMARQSRQVIRTHAHTEAEPEPSPNRGQNGSTPEVEAKPPLLRKILAGIIGASAVVIVIFLPTKIAFALTASLGLSCAAYIMPCLIFLKIDRECGWCRRIIVVLVPIFGCILLFGSTPVTIVQLLRESSGQPPVHLRDAICSQAQKISESIVSEAGNSII
jgi:amino acid permease